MARKVSLPIVAAIVCLAAFFKVAIQDSFPIREYQFQLNDGSYSTLENARSRRQAGYDSTFAAPYNAPYNPPYPGGPYPNQIQGESGNSRNFQQVQRPVPPRGTVRRPPGPPRPSIRPASPRAPPAAPAAADSKATKYYYPPRQALPLPTCFHNPTGYVCCNKNLNDLIVDAYTELEARPRFHACNINLIASFLQSKAEERFNTSFETIASFEDFAQKIHFRGDLACKVEIAGKYMLAYATVKNVDEKGLAGPEVGPQNFVARHHITRHYRMFI